MTKPAALAKRDPDPGKQIPTTRFISHPMDRVETHRIAQACINGNLPATTSPAQPGPRSVRLHPKPVAKGGGYCCGVCGAPGSIGQRCGYCRETIR